MKALKTSLFTAVGFAILVGALVLSGLQPQNVRGDEGDDDDAPSQVEVVNTPLMVDTGDLVLPSEIVSLTLSGPCTGGLTGFEEHKTDGTAGSSPFTVPAGNVLVVTSLQYLTTESANGVLVGVSLHRDEVAPETLVMTSGSISSGTGQSTSNETFPTGVVFGPGSEPCVSVSGQGSPQILNLAVQGYLAPDN